MTLCCNFYIFSQEEEVKISELKEVGNDTIIEILLVEENYPEIKELLKNYKEDSFFYNYTMGRVAYKENNKKDALNRFLFPQNKKSRLEVSNGEPTLCGVIIESDINGLSKSIKPLRIGGKLEQTNLE